LSFTTSQDAVIYRATGLATETNVVIKFPITPYATETEHHYLSLYPHPSIIPLVDTILITTSTPLPTTAPAAPGKALVLPFAQGNDLFDAAIEKHINERQVKIIIFKVIKALVYLHDNNVIHQDLKLENIIVMTRSPHSAVLADFGLSRSLGKSGAHTGTPCYSAPEVLLGNSCTKMSDMWSLGVTTFTAIARQFPFYSDPNSQDVKLEIKAGLPDYKSRVKFQSASRECQDFITRLLVMDPHQRLSAYAASQHPWFDDIRDIGDDEFDEADDIRDVGESETTQEEEIEMFEIAGVPF
jgi:serine/threonine protein kinase